MVMEKIDKYENSFQNRFRECDAYLERRFTEQRELFADETQELLDAIEASRAAPEPEVVEPEVVEPEVVEPVHPVEPTKVVEVVDEYDEPVIVREDSGEVVPPTVVEHVSEPEPVEEEEYVYVPDYDGRLQIATWNMGLARGFDPTVDLRLPLAAEAAAKMPADVVCLQEVWTQ